MTTAAKAAPSWRPAAFRWLLAVVATALLATAAYNVDFPAVRRGILAADGRWLLVAVTANLLVQPLAALQWRALLPATVPISWRRLLRIFAITSVANNSASSLIGHATGVAILAKEPSVGARGALSLLVLDQVAVGVAKGAVLLTAASLLPLPVWMQRGAFVLAGTLGVVAVVALLYARSLPFARSVATLPFVRSFVAVPPARMLVGVCCALAVKCLEAGGIAAVQLAFGFSCTIVSVVYVLAATTLASLVPIIPGNLGAYEAAVFLALRHIGAAQAPAMAIAVVQHACQLLAALAPGAPLLWFPYRRTAP